MSAPVLKRVTVLFHDEGDLEIAVAYTHSEASEPPTPATKTRTTRALRLAVVGLRRALEGLDKGRSLTWGGFTTNTRESTDMVIVERKEHAA
jgi:hypothetical protein